MSIRLIFVNVLMSDASVDNITKKCCLNLQFQVIYS